MGQDAVAAGIVFDFVSCVVDVAVFFAVFLLFY